jgi:hypothetical protein
MAKVKFDIKDKITELFEYILDDNSTLFRGLHDVKQYDINYNKVSWFSLDKSAVYKYAKDLNGIICSFKPKKHTIKLLNINSMFFRMHLMDQVNMNYTNDEKIPVFSALGIPNLELVKYVIDKYLKEKPKDACKEIDALETKLFAEYLGGHRLSEYTIDEIFANTLQKLYEDKFDGYISSLNWPTCHHKNFPPEICLFKPKQILTFISQVNYIPLTSKKGGTKKNKIKKWTPPFDSHKEFNTESVEEFNEKRKAELKKFEWNKPLKYDEEGQIKWPNRDEFTKHNFDRKFMKVDDWMKEYNSLPESMKIKIT